MDDNRLFLIVTNRGSFLLFPLAQELQRVLRAFGPAALLASPCRPLPLPASTELSFPQGSQKSSPAGQSPSFKLPSMYLYLSLLSTCLSVSLLPHFTQYLLVLLHAQFHLLVPITISRLGALLNFSPLPIQA